MDTETIQRGTCWSPECDGAERVIVIDSITLDEKCFTCRRRLTDYDAPTIDPRAVGDGWIAPEDQTLWAEAAYDQMPEPRMLAEVEGRTKARRLSKSERRRAKRAAAVRGARVRGHI